MKPSKRSRIVLGMDHGIPAKLAASLLRNQGYEVFPLHLSIDLKSVGEEPADYPTGFQTGPREELEKFCESLGVTLSVRDVTPETLAKVYDLLWMSTLSARPDAPEMRWNAEILLPTLHRFAREIGATAIATGHFAQKREGLYLYPEVEFDQSRALARVSAEDLNLLVTPLGDVSSEMFMRLARELALLPKKMEGEASGTGETELLRRYRNRPTFAFTRALLENPSVKARAPGFFNALNEAPPSTAASKIFLRDLFLQAGSEAPIYRDRKVSLGNGMKGTLRMYPGGLAEVIFPEAVPGFVRGQDAVFYEDSRLLGTGRIAEVG